MRKLKPKRQLMDDEIGGEEINEKNETLDGGKMQQRDEVNSRSFLRFPYIPILWVKLNDAQDAVQHGPRI